MKNVAEFLRLKLSVMSAREEILNSFLITTLFKMATNKESTKLILALILVCCLAPLSGIKLLYLF